MVNNNLLTVYKDTIGKTITLLLKEQDGTAINLTSATVTASLYSVGNNTLVTSHSCTVTSATNGACYYVTSAADFATAGIYYTLLGLSYESGNARTEVGNSFEVVQNEENAVTKNEFLEFIDIAEENAKNENVILNYLEIAETFINNNIPVLATTTNQSFIKIKKNLIKIKAAIYYFMNMDEGHIDPNTRIQKIKMWNDQYNLEVENMTSLQSSDTTSGSGIARRVKSSDYDDESSYLYGTDE